MRIEYQGHVEVRPSYSHVGYTSAQPMPGVFKGDTATAGLWLGLALLFAVAARRMATRGKGTLHLLAFLVSIAAAGGAAIGCFLALNHYDLTPPFTLTIQRMERLSDATETFQRKHGRLPTQQEWSALLPEADHVDGWGQPFAYLTETPRFSQDGQRYQVTVASATTRKTGRLSSAGFGPDGLFGTKDDNQAVADALGALDYRNVDLTGFPHARAPRPPGSAPPRRR